MRSLPLMAATTVILAGAWACGSDSNVGPNTSPVANFTAPACTVGVACTFTDASSDPDGTIASRGWDFGDGTTSQDQNPTHTFNAAQTYQVTLTVTDNGGATNSKTVPVTVTGGTTGNLPPTAAFTFDACTVGVPCAFHDASTDDVGVTGWSWNFGDGTDVDPNQNPTHQFGAEGTYQVQLTVTDAQGATNSTTVAVPVSAAAATQCTAGTVDVDCALTVTQRSTVTITLTDRNCELNDRVTIRPPFAQTAFFNVCQSGQVGDQYTIKDVGGLPKVFDANTQVVIRFTRGEPGLNDPPAGAPAANLTGTSPNWTIGIDDGGNIAAPRDFTDVTLSVQATPAQ
jgi:PKD repeat protein